MAIEFDKDGAPIITPTPLPEIGTVNDFVASVPPIPPVLPPDAIPSTELKKEPVGMDRRILDARAFNSNLNTSILPIPTEVVQSVNKDEELRFILKRYGMDSQQQGKAYEEIKALFE